MSLKVYDWFFNKNVEEQERLMVDARKHGKALKTLHRVDVKRKREERMNERKAKLARA